MFNKQLKIVSSGHTSNAKDLMNSPPIKTAKGSPTNKKLNKVVEKQGTRKSLLINLWETEQIKEEEENEDQSMKINE